MCRSLFCLHSSIQFALNILFRHVFTCFLFDVHDCLQFLTRKKASNFCTYHWSLIITTCTFRSSKTTCRDIRLNCSASRGVRSENHTHVSRGPTDQRKESADMAVAGLVEYSLQLTLTMTHGDLLEELVRECKRYAESQ